MRVGEPTPYILTDYDRVLAAAVQSVNSVPVFGTDGSLMVLVTKTLGGRLDKSRKLGFSPRTDAFDLIDLAHSPYASIVRTFDGGCSDQLLSRSADATSLERRAGGWILFPVSPSPAQWAPLSRLRVTTWRVQISPAGKQCATNHAAGLTTWSRPSRLTFETGKNLIAIRTDHYAADDLAQSENSFERFYFTREYGLSRWEAWWTVAHCRKMLGSNSVRCTTSPSNALESRCRGRGSMPGLQYFGGQSWVRVDCRDTTRWIALARPQIASTPQHANGNGVQDIDFARSAIRP